MTTARLAAPPAVVILCGGRGMRLFREETEFRPKPLVPIGDRPILWHIMQIYSAFGCRRFILALGARGDQIKRYFLDYRVLTTDFTLHLGTGDIAFGSHPREEPWEISFVDTGDDSMTGGRLLRLRELLAAEERFFLTYGDGVADVDIAKLNDLHNSDDFIATVTGVHPPPRFGEILTGNDNHITLFAEKPRTSDYWVNGGFFVCSPRIFDYLGDDSTVFEKEPLEALVAEGKLGLYKHEGFWHCMDTYRDYVALNDEWRAGEAPWKVW